jgi:hypoxanthine-DNA glycosylase
MTAQLKQSMPPVGAADARLLVLGSLPGDASLAARAYYAHPTNQFWRLLGHAIAEELAGLSHGDRLGRLAARGIALWDVVADAARSGSLDSAIRDFTTNPLAAFAATHPNLQAVAFNGRTAAVIGRRALAAVNDLTLIDLPSSSAAFTRPLTEKMIAWDVLGGFAAPSLCARVR